MSIFCKDYPGGGKLGIIMAFRFLPLLTAAPQTTPKRRIYFVPMNYIIALLISMT